MSQQTTSTDPARPRTRRERRIDERRRRGLEVEIESRHCARLRGYGSRDLIIELKQRPPLWSPLAHAWTVSARTARDVVALAESRNYDIVVLGPRDLLEERRTGPPVDLDRRRGEDLDRGLW